MPLTFQQFQELRRKGLSTEQIISFEAGNKPAGATAFPQEQPEQQKKGFFSKVASLTKGIGGALISSEKGVGESLAAGPAASLPIVRQAQESQTLADAGAVDILKAIRTNRELGRDTSRLEATYRDVTGQPAFDFNEIIPAAEKTNKQALGEVAGVGLDVVTAGTLSKGAQSFKVLKAAQPVAKASKALTTGAKLAQTAKSTAKAAAVGAGIGYGYDVVNSLQENESGGDIYKPGWGAALGAVLPAAFGAYKAGKISGNALGGRIDNSLIKPLAKDFRYGKNPGKTMAEMGIVANSQDELIANLRKARQSVGAELGQTAQNLSETLSQKKPVSINLTKALSPLDDAIEAAAKTNDQNLLNRVQQVKRALTERLTTGLDEAGNTIIQSQGKRPLIGGFDNALEFKRLVGEVTKWTGNPSDDKLINKALKQVYGNIDDVMMKQARKADPTLASQFEKLNGRYGDLITAEIATKHTAELTQRQNLISLPIKVGTATGVITAIATGGASIPAVLAGVGAGVLEKALGSTAVKTRVAAWLSKESPTVLEKLVRNNPKVRDVLYKTFIKENDIVDRKVLERLKKIKVEGVPVGLSVKNVSPKALDEITPGLRTKQITPEQALINEAKKHKTADGFVNSSLYEYHLSTEANLSEGKTFAKQITEPGSRNRALANSAEDGIYSTNMPQFWSQQLEYDLGSKAPKHVYLVRVKNPSPRGLLESGFDAQAVNTPQDVLIVKKLGTTKDLDDMGRVEHLKESVLRDIWKKANAGSKIDPRIAEAKKYKSAEEFVKAQFNKKPEYGMGHRPSWEGMPPAHNLLDGEALPRDVYTQPDFSIGGGRIRSGDKAANESWRALQKIKNNPEAEITVYRATRKNELNTGDWITFSKTYAEDSIEGSAEKVYSFKVKAKDVLFAGDDINEFGYYPKSQLIDIWKKAHKK